MKIENFLNRDKQDIVNMKEILDQSVKFLEGEISHEELINWSEKVHFYPYLPIREKIFNILYVLLNCQYSDDLTERFISLEMNKFWYMLISYTNIELNDELITEDNYNILFAVCYQWIYENVKTDYDVCLSLFDTILNVLKVEDLSMIFEELANTNFGDMIKSNNELVTSLTNNKEMVKNLANIMIYSNQDLSDVKNHISKNIIEEINSQKEE